MKMLKTKLFALFLLISFACKEDSEDPVAVANDEAAEMIATSISSGSGGLTLVIDDAAITTEENGGGRAAACGYTESMDATRTSPVGSSITYDYTFHYDYALVCDNSLPTEMEVNMEYSGYLDAPRMATENSGTGNLSVQTLDNTFTQFTISGSYNRVGSFESKVRNKNTSTSTITFTLTEITVDKTTREITGGIAAVVISGAVTGKGDFSYTGSITFKGDLKAELDVNGTKYSVDLESGEVITL